MTIIADLEALGKTEQEVAKKLQELDCKGTSDATDCPVANYLKTLGYENVTVESDDVFADKDGKRGGTETPLQIAEFITSFDDGNYQFLNKKKEP